MSANPIVSFDFDQQPVRTVERAGEPWFVLADICRVMGLTNPTSVAAKLDEDERSKFNLGRQGETVVVSESGLYATILRSRDAMTAGTVSYRFRRWVTHEVLPAIRKNGRYDMTGQRSAAQLEHADRTARRREIPRLMDRLERETNREKRRVIHAMLVQNCAANEIEPPAIELIGRDGLTSPDRLASFWAGIDLLREQGALINHSRVTGRLALNLREVAKQLAAVGSKIQVDQALRQTLRNSEHPRFLDVKSVNSAERKAAVHCFVFEEA